MKPPLAIAGFLAAALHALVLFGPSGSKPARPLPVAAESLEVELTAPPEEPLAVAEPPAEPPPEPDFPLPEPEPEPVPEAPPAPAPMPEPVREIVEPPKPQPPLVKMPKPKAKPATAPPRSTTPSAGIAKAPVKTAGFGTSKVRVRSNPAPAYPTAARQARQEGTVTVDVEVSTAGLPLNVRLARSSGFPALDQAALAAVRRWRFEPARAAGVAVNGHVIVPLRFELK